MVRTAFAFLASVVCSVSIAAAQSPSLYCPIVPDVYAIQDLGDFMPNAINELGQVVGSHYTGVEWRVVSWTPSGGAVDLGPGYAYDVNNRGAIVFVHDSAAWVRWPNGTRQQLAPAGSVAYGINDWNEVVGFITETVFIWRPATGLQLLEFPTNTIDDQPTYDINNTGTIALTSQGSLRLRRRSGAVVTAAVELQARAINELERVVGVMPYFHAATWTARDGLTDLGTLGGMNSDAIDVNDVSWIVGRSDVVNGDVHAFVVKPGGAMADLGALGGECTGLATGINDAGQVVGSSHDDFGRFRATLWQLRLTPAEALDSLAASVRKLRNGGLVHAADATLLLAKIAQARRHVSTDAGLRRGPMTAFAAHVRQLARRGRLSDSIAAALIYRSDHLMPGPPTLTSAPVDWTHQQVEMQNLIAPLETVAYSQARAINDLGRAAGQYEWTAWIWGMDGTRGQSLPGGMANGINLRMQFTAGGALVDPAGRPARAHERTRLRRQRPLW